PSPILHPLTASADFWEINMADQATAATDNNPASRDDAMDPIQAIARGETLPSEIHDSLKDEEPVL
ncbi:MAG: hypothetical protein AAFY88_17920, partial [Acidobacteriota bacterium]